MKKFLLFLLFFACTSTSQLKSQVNVIDSIALVELYNSTGGPNWTNHTGWLNGPIRNWFGVGVQWSYDNSGNITSGRVNGLDLRSNHLNGTLPNSIGNLSELTYLVFFNDTLLTGPIPASIGNLTKLTYLFMGGNRFTGAIPSTIGNLLVLQSLFLEGNRLSGAIPGNLSGLTAVREIHLEDNLLTGDIPSYLGQYLINLQDFIANNNQLTGSIPASFGYIRALKNLTLSHNQLSGAIPPDFGNINGSSLQSLWLNVNNLSGSIPATLQYCYSLQAVVLDYNQLTGSIPSELGTLYQLSNFSVANNQLTGVIPTTFKDLASLHALNISNNKLEGPIPTNLANLPLTAINLSNNKFVFDRGLEKIAAKPFAIYSPQATLPTNKRTLGINYYQYSTPAYFEQPFGYDATDQVRSRTKFLWYNNGVLERDTLYYSPYGDSTYIPSFQDGTGTRYAVITNANIPGLTLYSQPLTVTPFYTTEPIKDSLYLTYLYNNTGGAGWTNKTNWLVPGKPISTWYGIATNSYGRVQAINLPNNNLTGPLPDSLGAIQILQTLNLPNNHLSGAIPAALGNLYNLQTLNLGTNSLTGSIPSGLGNLTNLQYLTLNWNSLSGSIPASLGNLTKLRVLDMWVNQFTGSLPPELGNCTQLTTVWLAWNQLTGAIPASFGNLIRLAEMHLDNNQLSGTIPAALTALPGLTNLTVGTNRFTFSGMEAVGQRYPASNYSPQATIPLLVGNGVASVDAGGNLSNNTYRWYQNNVLVATNTGNASYTPTGTGSVYVKVSNSLATGLTLTSSSTCPPTITLLASTNLFTVPGVSIRFGASYSNGGTAPVFTYRVNGVVVQSSSSNVFTSTTLQPNDVVTCTITSNATCAAPATITSNSIVIISISNSGGIITRYAGGGTDTTGNGIPATNAGLRQPVGVCTDKNGNVYVADGAGNRVRKITPAGVISTIAGTGTAGFSGDGGLGTAAQVDNPYGIYVDAALNVYIGTSDFRVRRVDGNTGIITTLAGTGTQGYSGDGGAATAAKIGSTQGLTGDAAGNIYFADYYSSVVRKINTSGIISTVAGNGTTGYSGDGGAATSATLGAPNSVSFDAVGNLYIGDDYPNSVRKVNTAGIISTVVGGSFTNGDSGDGGAATSALFQDIECARSDSAGNLLIADASSRKIRIVNTSGIISTIAGTGVAGYNGDSLTAINARLNAPWSVCADKYGDVYVGDAGNALVRKVTIPSVSNTNGNWSNASTWSKGRIPDAATIVIINQPVVVDTNAKCWLLKVQNQNFRVNTGVTLDIRGH